MHTNIETQKYFLKLTDLGRANCQRWVETGIVSGSLTRYGTIDTQDGHKLWFPELLGRELVPVDKLKFGEPLLCRPIRLVQEYSVDSTGLLISNFIDGKVNQGEHDQRQGDEFVDLRQRILFYTDSEYAGKTVTLLLGSHLVKDGPFANAIAIDSEFRILPIKYTRVPRHS